jgi:hypothetical protein
MDSLSWVALGLIFFVIVLIVTMIVCLHMVPGKVARANNHPQLKAIEACSLMGLIIFPFWMVAMVWANIRPARVMMPESDGEGEAAPREPVSKEKGVGDGAVAASDEGASPDADNGD